MTNAGSSKEESTKKVELHVENRAKRNTKNSWKDYYAVSDDSSDDKDSDFDEGSHCYACRGSYSPALCDNDAQIMWVECDQCHYWDLYLCQNIESEDEIKVVRLLEMQKLK